MLLFEVLNDKKVVVYHTHSIKDIPKKEFLVSMDKAGYKFRVDGKLTSKSNVEKLRYSNERR